MENITTETAKYMSWIRRNAAAVCDVQVTIWEAKLGDHKSLKDMAIDMAASLERQYAEIQQDIIDGKKAGDYALAQFNIGSDWKIDWDYVAVDLLDFWNMGSEQQDKADYYYEQWRDSQIDKETQA